MGEVDEQRPQTTGTSVRLGAQGSVVTEAGQRGEASEVGLEEIGEVGVGRVGMGEEVVVTKGPEEGVRGQEEGVETEGKREGEEETEGGGGQGEEIDGGGEETEKAEGEIAEGDVKEEDGEVKEVGEDWGEVRRGDEVEGAPYVAGKGGGFDFFSSPPFFGCDFRPFFRGAIIFLIVTGEEDLSASLGSNLFFSYSPFIEEERMGREGSKEGAGNCGEDGGERKEGGFNGGDSEQERGRFFVSP